MSTTLNSMSYMDLGPIERHNARNSRAVVIDLVKLDNDQVPNDENQEQANNNPGDNDETVTEEGTTPETKPPQDHSISWSFKEVFEGLDASYPLEDIDEEKDANNDQVSNEEIDAQANSGVTTALEPDGIPPKAPWFDNPVSIATDFPEPKNPMSQNEAIPTRAGIAANSKDASTQASKSTANSLRDAIDDAINYVRKVREESMKCREASREAERPYDRVYHTSLNEDCLREIEVNNDHLLKLCDFKLSYSVAVRRGHCKTKNSFEHKRRHSQ